MTMLQRLISYFPRDTWDKRPDEAVLFRLHHPAGATWTVEDGLFNAKGGQTSLFEADLSVLTVQQLADALVTAGFEVTDRNPELARSSALLLVEGSGDQLVSNGNRVLGFTSLLWALMSMFAAELRQAKNQVTQALRQMIITQAEGEWLDLWGKVFNVRRLNGEQDPAYSTRIPKEVFRLRLSPIAIEQAVLDQTGKVIKIEEPWETVFRLDMSELSGPDRMQDGNGQSVFYIQPTSVGVIDWSDVLPVIERNKAAGVIVLPPLSRVITRTNANIAGVATLAIAQERVRNLQYDDHPLLDFSNIEDTAIPNNPSFIGHQKMHVSASSYFAWGNFTWPDVTWTDTSIQVEFKFERSYRELIVGVYYSNDSWVNQTWADNKWDNNDIVAPASQSIFARQS